MFKYLFSNRQTGTCKMPVAEATVILNIHLRYLRTQRPADEQSGWKIRVALDTVINYMHAQGFR